MWLGVKYRAEIWAQLETAVVSVSAKNTKCKNYLHKHRKLKDPVTPRFETVFPTHCLCDNRIQGTVEKDSGRNGIGSK